MEASIHRIASALLLLSVCTAPVTADQPVGWRNDGSGRFPLAAPPTQWSGELNVLWKTPLPGRSISSPIVSGDRVFTTAEPAELLCLRPTDGKVLWQRAHTYFDVFDADKARVIEADLQQAESLRRQSDQLRRELDERTKAGAASPESLEALQHQIAVLDQQVAALQAYPPIPGGDTGNTTSTPISDGRRVYAIFGTGIVSSHALDGRRQWMTFVAAPGGSHSASPLLVDGLLIVHLRELIALEAATGKVVWHSAAHAKHGTPVAARVGDTSVIITPAGAIVRAADGHILNQEQFHLGYCSPIVHERVIYAVQDGTTKALKLPDTADEPFELEVLWETKGAEKHRLASPVWHDGLLYSITEEGILDVLDGATGKLVYRKRLPFRQGRADPSLALAGDLLFASSNAGDTVVVQPGREYREVAHNHLDPFMSSPLFVGPRMYVRTQDQLFCIGSLPPTARRDQANTPKPTR